MAKSVSKYCVLYTVFTAMNAVLENMRYVLSLKQQKTPLQSYL